MNGRIKYSLYAFLDDEMFTGLCGTTLTEVNGLSPSAIGFVLVPAAIASAIMGRKGSKLADDRGNFALVLVASVLLFLAFFLLSTFIGLSAYFIAIILIFGNVGQTFMQISMSNTISRTLPKEETGVGMGLLSMINFISGAMAMSVVGKMLDEKQETINWMRPGPKLKPRPRPR